MANDNNVKHLPEHGPLDENGREILLSLKNVDITFGKGDSAVKPVNQVIITDTVDGKYPSDHFGLHIQLEL